MKCQCDDIGEREGHKIQAITDSFGPQVVVTGKKHQLSKPLKNHEEAVALANRVVTEGFDVCEWLPPVSSIGETYMRLFVQEYKEKAGV